VTAIARHAGLELPVEDWERVGHEIHLLVNLQPAGKYLCESYHRAGGVPAVMGELLRAGKLRENAMTVTGKTVGENYRTSRSVDREVIKTYDEPLMRNAGFLVLRGNLCGSALLKTSVISEDFRRRFLSTPGDEEAFTSRVIVFEGPEDYRKRIDDPELAVDERCMLVIRGTGPVGYPGSAEVVNMTPPGYLVKAGTRMLPCLGDGRQSGTSDSPSILHVSPESAAGGNLAILRTGDFVRVDLKKRRIDIQISDEEIAERRRNLKLPELRNDSPWQELFRAHVGQLDTGAVLEFAVKYRRCRDVVPRHSH
jgi:dihydroxy-acid dehydratase